MTIGELLKAIRQAKKDGLISDNTPVETEDSPFGTTWSVEDGMFFIEVHLA